MDSFSPADRDGARFPAAEQDSARRILTVGQLNRAVAGLIERNLPLVWVRGEISNLTRAASGHWYFTLKDAQAQVRAVMFRMRAQRVGFVPRDGMRIEVSALASLYEARGEFQLNVEAMRQAGAGDLYQQFLQLKEQLQREGLFDSERKRTLPTWPARIGIITSPAGAALHDALTTLRRRAPALDVIVYPTPVQGSEAPARIVAALNAAARRGDCDVVLLIRGGGSIEDLWAFNDVAVARAVAAMPMPVVSGVGHETDFTIVDFVADLRAATPTAAAAAATPDRHEWLQRTQALARAVLAQMTRSLERREQRLDLAARLLKPPAAQWQQRAHRLQVLAARLHHTWSVQRREDHHRFTALRLRLHEPPIEAHGRVVDALAVRLHAAVLRTLERRGERTELHAMRHELASPNHLLERGYAIVRDADGKVVRDADQTAVGQTLDVLLARGRIDVVRR